MWAAVIFLLSMANCISGIKDSRWCWDVSEEWSQHHKDGHFQLILSLVHGGGGYPSRVLKNERVFVGGIPAVVYVSKFGASLVCEFIGVGASGYKGCYGSAVQWCGGRSKRGCKSLW